MNNLDFARNAVYKILRHYGETSQIDMAIEEMSELTKALLKSRRYGVVKENPHRNIVNKPEKLRKDVIEEIADVGIMLEQLIIIFNCEIEVKQEIKFKLGRQLDRMRFGG